MKQTIRLNERELHRLISESVKRTLNEGWMQIQELDDAYETLTKAIQDFEDTVMERAEFMNNDDDERVDPSEYFTPQEDIEALKNIAAKIKNDYSKSQTYNISHYKRDNGNFFKRV